MNNANNYLNTKTSIVLLVIFFVSTFTFETKAQQFDCKSIDQTILNRQIVLQKYVQSLDYLLGLGGKPELDLTVLFQVDLDNKTGINKRKQELAKEITPQQVMKLSEFTNYFSCNLLAENKKKVDNLAKTISEINLKKLQFLKIEAENRLSLISSYKSERRQLENTTKLDTQLQVSSSALEVAQQNLRLAEERAINEANKQLEPINSARSLLEKGLVDLETEQLSFISAVKGKSDKLSASYSDLTKAVKTLELKSSKDVSESYAIVVNIWREAADGLLILYRGLKIDFTSQAPELLSFRIESEKEKALYQEYTKAFENYKQHRQNLVDERVKLINELKAQNFNLLNESGSFRARLLHQCDEIECNRSRGLTKANLLDLQREFKIVPLKLLARGLSKWLEVKTKINSGFDGQVDILKQIFMLIGAILIPIILMRALRWGSSKLDQMRKNLLSKSMMDYKKRTHLAIWISRLNPFVPFVGMILAISYARAIIEGTYLSEFSSVLFYIKIYFIYRIARLFLTIVFELIFSAADDDHLKGLKTLKIKIKRSTKTISRLFFVEYVLLHLTEDAVRKALAYLIFSTIINWLNIVILFYGAYIWRSEIVGAFTHRFPSLKNKFSEIIKTKWNIALLPLMLVSVIVHDLYRFISSYLSQTEIIKRISSEVLRIRLERVEKGPLLPAVLPPKDYLDAFDYYMPAFEDTFVEREETKIKEIVMVVREWAQQKNTDDLVVVVGNRGMGKTTTLNYICKKLEGSLKIKTSKVPARTINREELFLWLGQFLAHPMFKIDDIKTFDQELKEKTILVIDDIHNLFLATNGGFDSYRLFLEIINLKTQNIFWCLSINLRSWDYLKGVFGDEHFYGKAFYLEAWNELEIQKLITLRHNKLGFKKNFDDSIRAYGTEDALGERAEAQFFRLLWGQSRGNPRSAMMYWVSAISYPSEKFIHVGIPAFFNSALVSTMSDDALFLLAAITRHENISSDELKLVTNISTLIIRKCLKEALDKQLIWIDEFERVRISSRAQYIIDYFLNGKNFIYE